MKHARKQVHPYFRALPTDITTCKINITGKIAIHKMFCYQRTIIYSFARNSNVKYSFHKTSGAPLKLWDSHRKFDDNAMEQLKNVATLPFIHEHVAGMPDVHWGMGATVGSVIATKGAIIPAAVGVDIGCGMMAIKTSLHANDLPDNLHSIRDAIEKAVPHGRTDNGMRNDKGRHQAILPEIVYMNFATLEEDIEQEDRPMSEHTVILPRT